jgi:hypothetical protein
MRQRFSGTTSGLFVSVMLSRRFLNKDFLIFPETAVHGLCDNGADCTDIESDQAVKDSRLKLLMWDVTDGEVGRVASGFSMANVAVDADMSGLDDVLWNGRSEIGMPSSLALSERASGTLDSIEKSNCLDSAFHRRNSALNRLR